MIHGLILDYGKVLCQGPLPDRIAWMADALTLDRETFAARWEEERGPYDRGDIGHREYWSRVAAGSVDLDDELIGRLRQWDVEMWSDVDRAMTAWVDRVHEAGFKTALLSNMHDDMAAHARRTFGWLARMDSVTISCEVRLAKPERAIYERCLEGIALRPEEVLFIDDREANVQAAREAGLWALRFESAEQLRADLKGLGFPVLPAE